MERSSGILMPVFSLPSPYGIGTVGKAAKNFIDFLSAAGQRWWQMLPLGPTSFGDSPYQSPSTFAGNPYFIDPDMLVEDGLLTEAEINSFDWGSDPEKIDYALLYANRYELLEKAFERGWEKDAAEVAEFSEENSGWLPDYAVFMAVKKHFGMVSWIDWPDKDIRLHRPEAVEKYGKLLEKDVRFYTYLQYLFFKQWHLLKAYAEKKGIGIIGDLPIYVALDSADVWAAPEYFQLDRNNVPKEVAGVPADYFNQDGQLWGNPLYDYERMAEDGYGWWIRRIGGAKKLYDMIRIDHFRGFESYWAVPYGAKTARNGRWVKGPGMDLVGVLKNWFPRLHFIAEDLGYPSAEVRKLLADSGFPGMKLIEFAFDVKDENTFLPHSFSTNCVCYIGTHDNPPVIGWKESAEPWDLANAKEYLGLNDEEGFARGIIRAGMSSVADLFVAQMQDYLELGTEARINVPGTIGGNWLWRSKPGAFTPQLAERIARMTKIYGRSN
ncbi:MAG: 4-alpha-glucanotransferase [Firmicutes bacterium]|nr:4-alpha-glucanotransferase [Bacillota bacterium]